MSALLEALQYVGSALDKPRRALMGGLTGTPREIMNLVPFSDALGLTDPSEAFYGEQVTGAPLTGMLMDIATDPLNLLLGVGLASKLAKTTAQHANRAKLLKMGAMPEEIAEKTLLPDRMFRVTSGEVGPMRYFDNPELAMSDYAGWADPRVQLHPRVVTKELAPEYRKAAGTMKSADAALNKAMNSIVNDSVDDFDLMLPMLDDAAYDVPALSKQWAKAKGDVQTLQNLRSALIRDSGELPFDKYGQLQSRVPGASAHVTYMPPVRTEMARLNVQNPLNVGNLIDDADLNTMLQRLHPEVAQDVRLWRNEVPAMSGQDLYDALWKVPGGPNRALSQMGYDAVTGMGHIEPFNRSQVYSNLIAPRAESYLSSAPLLAALLGHNELRTMR